MATYRDVIVLEGKRYKSPTWAYFEVKDEENKIAACNLCQDTYSFKTTVTNLSKHLKKKHNLVFLKKEGEGNENEYVIHHATFKLNKNEQKNTGTVKVAWDYFNIKNAEMKTASCIECDEILSYKHNEDDLVDHLLAVHSISVTSINKDSDRQKDHEITVKYEEIEETSEETAISVWEYFDRKNESLEVAFCSLCEEAVSYRDSLDKMLEHLMLKHDISRTCEELQDSEPEVESSPPKERRHGKSIAWEYFDVHDLSNKTARCRLCGSICSYNTSVTNLMKHVHRHMKRMGKSIKKSGDGKLLLHEELSKKPKHRNQSKIWRYFRCVDPARKIALCLICKERISYGASMTNLKRHFGRKHPDVAPELFTDGLEGDSESNRILVATGDHIYELQTNDPDDSGRDCSDQDDNVEELETVYVDEFENQSGKRKERDAASDRASAAKLLKRELNGGAVKVLDRSDAAGDSLDRFGPYIVALLRQLPKKVSNQLQVDFVKRVIEAQMEADGDGDGDGDGDDHTGAVHGPAAADTGARDDDSNQSTSAPEVWSFFEQETGGRARCVVCRATLPHRLKELKKHLKNNHPKLAQDFDECSENEDDQNDTYTEVVYLEDDSRKSQKREALHLPKRRQSYKSATPVLKKAKKRKTSSSSDEYPGEKSIDDNDDQIQKFGTYITCLLRKMPKDVCTKLQMDIINLIMMTKLKLPSESDNKMLLDGVPVTIQSVTNVPGAGYIVTVPSSSDSAKQHVAVAGADVKDDPLIQNNPDMPKITVTNTTTQDMSMHC